MKMPTLFNMFEENWVIKMNEMFEKAKSNRGSYEKFIDLLEDRFTTNPDDKRVKGYVARLRQILWPDNQYAKEPSMLEVIPFDPKETFSNLKQGQNYEKFVQHFSQTKGPMPAKAA